MRRLLPLLLPITITLTILTFLWLAKVRSNHPPDPRSLYFGPCADSHITPAPTICVEEEAKFTLLDPNGNVQREAISTIERCIAPCSDPTR